MTTLVLGTDGMLGSVVFKTLLGGRRADVVGTTRKEVPGADQPDRLIELSDVRDASRLEVVLDQVRPVSVVNCVGVLSGFGDDDTMADVNGTFPHRLASACEARDARVIQISTDAVFSGRRGPYDEDAPPDPIDAYGRSKLHGELQAGPHLTVRTSVIGRSAAGRGLVEWAISQRGREVAGYARALWSGVTARELVRLLEPIIWGEPAASGLIHVNAEPVSKAQLIERISNALDLGLRVRPVDAPVIDRRLVTGRVDSPLTARPLDDQLRELALDG